jgi:hypothetical protein
LKPGVSSPVQPVDDALGYLEILGNLFKVEDRISHNCLKLLNDPSQDLGE